MKLLSIVLLAAVASFSTATAQSSPPENQVQPSQLLVVQEIQQKIQTARQLMRQGSYDGAMAILETAYEQMPENSIIINLLKNCYRQQKLYAKAETLLRREIELRPNDFQLRLELAESLLDQGEVESGKKAYQDVVALIRPEAQLVPYQLVIRSMLAHNLTDDALALIAQLRTQQNNPALFAIERGQILEAQKQYREAALEYVPLLANDTAPEAVEAERRLLALLDFQESSKDAEKALVQLAKSSEGITVIRILCDYYVRAERFEEGFQYALKRDSLEGHTGGALLYYMRQCHDRKRFDQAVKAGDYLVTKSKHQFPMLPELLFTYADALTHTGKYQDAIARYDTLAKLSPLPGDRAEALYRIGMVYCERLGQYDQAQVYFDSVVSRYPQGMPFLQSQRMIPFCHLRSGDLAAARANFLFVRDRQVTPDMMEEVDYYVALINFMEAKYDSAKVGFRKLMVDYPQGLYVNDALQLVLMIDEVEGKTEMLDQYGQALRYAEQQLLDSATARLQEVAKTPGSPLADDALHRLTDYYMQQADSAAALDVVGRLATEHPDSYFVPYGLKLKADILVLRPESREAARAIYRELLEKYANYPFASEVRKKLRELEQTSVG